MRLTMSSRLLPALLFSSLASSTTALAADKDSVKHDDNAFWDRLLANDGSFPTPAPKVDCFVDVTIDCVSSDGSTPCENILPPPGICAIGSVIEYVTFSYNPTLCVGSSNVQGTEAFCEDCEPLVAGPVTVSCSSLANKAPLPVEPSVVNPGETFTVSPSTPGAPLPDKIDCVYEDGDGTKIQQVYIDTSGDVTLDLKDTFGSFTLESCAPNGQERSCLETLCYDIDISNIGTVDMLIDVVDFTLDDQTSSFLDAVDPQLLPPDQSTSLEIKTEVDICTSAEFCALINVEANPPNGDMCQDMEELKFTVPEPPTRSPTASPVTPETESPVIPPVVPPTKAPVPPPTPRPVVPPTSEPVAPPTPAPVVPIPPPTLAPVDLIPPVFPPTPRPVIPPTPRPVTPPTPRPVTPPTPRPVIPPTPRPVIPPTPRPVIPPTPRPVIPPTPRPVIPPTPRPVIPPTPRPVIPPTPRPVIPPTPRPIIPPTPRPITPPTNAPVPPPTPAPVVVPEPCLVEVELECISANGRPCNEIQSPPTRTCTGGPDIEVVAFSYQNCVCDSTSNSQGDAATCEDSAPLVEDDVTVSCAGLTVAPTTVPPGGIFSVSVPGGGMLPNVIDCSIIGPDGTMLQRVTLNTSGTLGLELGDKFGSLQLESCNDLTCKELLCYNVEINNIGRVPMDITVLGFMLDETTVSFLDRLNGDVSVPVGQVRSVEEKIVVDICGGQEYCASVSVEANPPNGEMCQATDEEKFSVTPVPPPPPVAPPTLPPSTLAPTPPSVCDITLNTECVITGDSSYAGQSCDVPILGVEPCLERPTAASMLFNGGGCEQSDNTQELKFTCTDSNGGPPVNEGEQAYIVVTDIKGNGITYFEGLVAVGDIYNLNDGGERFEADMFIMIYTPDQSTLLQMVQYHSSCSSNLELKNRFGASQLVAFFNEVQGEVSCFATFSFSLDIAVPIEATGDDIKITSLTADTSFAGLIDLTPQVINNPPLGPGGNVVVTLEGTIDASSRMQYTILYNIEGTRVTDNSICTGMDLVTFEAGRDPSVPAGIPTDGGGSKSKRRRI